MPKIDKTKTALDKSTETKYNGARWLRSEEQLLLKMRDFEKASFERIGEKLRRKPYAVERRYEKLKEEAALPDNFVWTSELDDEMIKGRQAKKTFRLIAADMNLPPIMVQERLVVLRKAGLVDVVPHPRSTCTPWTEEEDEVFVRMYIAMADETEIHKTAKLAGRSVLAIKARKQFHLVGDKVGGPRTSLMYRTLLRHYNNPSTQWSKQDVIDRKFVVGSWERTPEAVQQAKVYASRRTAKGGLQEGLYESMEM